MPIEAVTFDWWHTVAETPWPDYDERMRTIRVQGISDELRTAGIETDEASLYGAYDRLEGRLRETWAHNADLRSGEQVNAFLEYAGLRDRGDLHEGIMRAFGEAMLENMPILQPHIADTLAGLKADGYRIGMVSNTGRTWGRFLRQVQDRLGIAGYFDVRVFSDEVEIRKPGRGIFERALAALGVKPATAVHVGDDVEADVAGARGVGIRAIWYNNGSSSAADATGADAVIRDFAELPPLLRSWRTA